MAQTDREKSLNTALAQIEKQFGRGAIMRLGEESRAPIEVIPTGAIALDVALGIGGLPRGRIVEIYGPEASGKCLTADALIPTNWGLLTVAEIFRRCGTEASCTSRTTDIAHLGLRVLNEFGEMESVTVLTHNNRKPTLRITTAAGRSVTVTHNHPIRTMNRRGNVVWRRAGRLAVGDVVLGVLGGDPDAKDQITVGEATLLGYLIGDGHVKHPNRVMFSQVDRQVAAEFQALVADLFPSATFKAYDHRPNDVWIHSKAFREHLHDALGLGYHGAQTKEIPEPVRASGPEVHRAFLSALYECDGGVEEGQVCLSTASETLAAQVQVMLNSLGITATRVQKFAKDYPGNVYWTIRCTGSGSGRFAELIGFRSDRRAAQVATIRTSTDAAQLQHVPYQGDVVRDLRDAAGSDRSFDRIAGDLFRSKDDGSPFIELSPRRLRRILAWAQGRGLAEHPLAQHLRALVARPATYERITSIEDAGLQPTFDLMVPGTHSFVANGMAVHNTSLGLHAIASVQSMGGIAAFIDAEHALDPTYAGNLGVDLDSLYVAQPDNGEQALEITDTLVRSAAIDLIVIDSVAALVPRAEIEGEMGDSHVGLQARLMSQALRKMAGALSNSHTTAVFINQLREKIGVSFGSPETTTGGRALKFYSSVRLDVRRIETLKGGNEAVGNRTRVKVVKNKCLAEGTMVFDPVTGQARDIAEIVDQRLPVHVAAVDKQGVFHARPVVSWFDQGEQEVIGIRVRGGAEIWVTPDHRILTDRGWQEAQALQPGALVARPQWMETSSATIIPEQDHSAARSAIPATNQVLVGATAGGGRGGVVQVTARTRGLSPAHLRGGDGTQGADVLGVTAFTAVDEILPAARRRTFDVEVQDDHNLVANGIVVHNCAPPFKQAEFDVIYGLGISREGSLIDLGVDNGIVRKSGAWYTYENDQLGQGKENARAFLRDNPDLADEIEKRIKELLGIIPRVDVPADPAPPTGEPIAPAPGAGANGAGANGAGAAGAGSARGGATPAPPLVPPTPIDL